MYKLSDRCARLTNNPNSTDLRKAIIDALRQHPEGLTLRDIAEIVGRHRHTITKYVYELIGAQVIYQRDVGAAKLCYLKENYNGETKKERAKIFKNTRKGQAQLVALFLLLLLVPATVIVAQNVTAGLEGMATALDLLGGNISDTSFSHNIAVPDTTTKIIENSPEPEQPQESNETPKNLCDGVVCETYNTTCPDGFISECIGLCDPETATCSECIPSCEGHEIPGPEPEPNCTENWTCSEWSECENDLQIRTCFDVNNCGTAKNKPSQNQTCPEEICDIECGECAKLDEINCTCSPIITCVPGDGCCPARCDYLNDSDCLPLGECSVDSDCDDNNTCTTDVCSANRTCSNIPITPCCGNGKCETVENQTSCPNDCLLFECLNNSDCDDDNICTLDVCSNYTCFNTPTIPCCGNGVCEENENYTNCQADCVEIPEPLEPELFVDIIAPEKIIRGQTAELKAVIENSGGEAKNIVLEWILPDFFEVIDGFEWEEVGTLATNSSFIAEITVSSRLDAALGINEIKVRVSYE